MTPLAYYQNQCEKGLITEDLQQINALQQLDKIYDRLLQEHAKRSHPFALLRKPQTVKGLYLWGGVGIGKTLMMDCFYHSIPFAEKMRIHFHQFMRLVHTKLKKYQGKKDPLKVIAKKFAKKYMLLCFDELFVIDITDAMILGRLFKLLFSYGVCMVITSNSEPDQLYKNGLQRDQFLPAIDLIKRYTTVIAITTLQDYRLRHLKQAGVYYTPNNASAQNKMENSFHLLTKEFPVSCDPIKVNDREIQIKKTGNQTIWFDFEKICNIPRSQQDYLFLAQHYHTVLISDIPLFNPDEQDKLYLFILLVDVFYDAHIRLILSAAAQVDKLYTKGNLLFDYARTRSRLLEMQSEAYFMTSPRLQLE